MIENFKEYTTDYISKNNQHILIIPDIVQSMNLKRKN
jgi:hypothetical protein